ncbi:MAG TPA: hypothetical protein VMM92_09915, partial [Thermoanaerobaculia bacterium]|nr:hypothetical protein [Thermoanaerobaculia bacterium]
IYDLLPALLRRDLAPLALLPPGAAAVWPLVPGFSDDPGFWEEAAALLASRQVACLQALPPQLDPADRRRLVELGGEGIFDAVFHGGGAGAVRDGVVPAERSFARLAGRWGLAPFLPRPLPRPPILRGENRRLAGVLALVAELWLRLGRPVGQGQGLYAMARQVDRTGYDLAALAREGNLGVLSWLDGTGREVALELATAGRSSLLASLLAEYAGGEGEET